METLREALVFLLSLAAKAASPALRSRLSDLSIWLVPDAPILTGAWVVRFREPMLTRGARTRELDAHVRQFGRRIQATGHVQGNPEDPFEYRGTVRRNVLYGTFRRKNSRILAGTGTFVLEIAADSRSMRGYSTWFDSNRDQAWNSRYEWRRRS